MRDMNPMTALYFKEHLVELFVRRVIFLFGHSNSPEHQLLTVSADELLSCTVVFFSFDVYLILIVHYYVLRTGTFFGLTCNY